MLEDLTLSITELQNGAKLTYHYRFTKKEGLSFAPKPSFIIDLLKLEFTRLGLVLNTDGITCSTSTKNGGTNILSQG